LLKKLSYISVFIIPLTLLYFSFSSFVHKHTIFLFNFLNLSCVFYMYFVCILKESLFIIFYFVLFYHLINTIVLCSNVIIIIIIKIVQRVRDRRRNSKYLCDVNLKTNKSEIKKNSVLKKSSQQKLLY